MRAGCIADCFSVILCVLRFKICVDASCYFKSFVVMLNADLTVQQQMTILRQEDRELLKYGLCQKCTSACGHSQEYWYSE